MTPLGVEVTAFCATVAYSNHCTGIRDTKLPLLQLFYRITYTLPVKLTNQRNDFSIWCCFQLENAYMLLFPCRATCRSGYNLSQQLPLVAVATTSHSGYHLSRWLPRVAAATTCRGGYHFLRWLPFVTMAATCVSYVNTSI